jgi:2-polyprenyl-3-methyl-5-hydroxy-6-metoxy-1,4-benzoquinol methylase
MFSGPQHKTEVFERLGLKVDEKEGKVAIDLGCGNGFQAIPLGMLGWKVLGIDSSPFLLEELEQEALTRNLKVSGIEGIFGLMKGICWDFNS